MGKETKYYCDNCGKEIWWQSNCATINVYAAQGPREELFNKISWEDDWPHWKHRKVYKFVLCENCIGEKVTVNCGDTAHFSLSNCAKTFLKKVGFIK